MAERPSELTWTLDGMVARVRLRGSAVLASPVLSRGTAFTLAERQALGLAVLAGFSELNLQIARDVRQPALAGPPILHDRYPQDAGAVLGS